MSVCICCGSTRSHPLFEIESHPLVQCADCGLERISPQPADEIISAIYGQHYYNAWGLDKFEDLVSQQKIETFRLLLTKLGTPPQGARLLDCGAATGFLMTAAKELGYTPYGVELSEYGAKSIAAKFGEGYVYRGELQEASFPTSESGGFAVVTMCDFIEHVRDPGSALDRAYSLLAPGGRLVITTPNRAGVSRIIMGKRWSQYKLEHLYYFNPENIMQLLGRRGFTGVTVGAAAKKICLQYIFAYFGRYRHPLITPMAKAGERLLPEAILARMMTLVLGDMLVIAYKK